MARFEEFWEVICAYQMYLRFGFMMMIFLFVLTIISLVLADPGTGAFAIAGINFVMAGFMTAVMAYLNRVCSVRERKHY